MDNTLTPTPPAAPPQSDPAYAKPGAVLVIPRVVFNYVVIAIVFFALGAGVTTLGYNALFNANSAENQELITKAVSASVQAGGGGTAANQQPQAVQGQRYEVSADDDPFIGPADAPITIIEFSDFRCPYCGRFNKETKPQLLENFAGKIRFVYRDFPILSQASVEAALAAQCANDQNQFWAFHDLLFSNQQNLTRDAYLAYAEQLKLDVETFTQCYDNRTHLSEVSADYQAASTLGISGTPAFFINGQFLNGAQPYNVFADIINAQLSGEVGESTPEAGAS